MKLSTYRSLPAPVRIVMLLVGSAPEIRSYLPVAGKLVDDGYRVTIVTHPDHEGLIQARAAWRGSDTYGFRTVGPSLHRIWDTVEPLRLALASNPIHALSRLAEISKHHARLFLDDCWLACRDADVLLHSPLGMAACNIAEKLRIPGFQLGMQPEAPTKEFAIPFMAGQGRFPSWCNRASYFARESLSWLALRKVIDTWRVQTLGLPGLGWREPTCRQRVRRMPIVVGCGTGVLARPVDWPKQAVLSGFWGDSAPTAWKPPDDLAAFLDYGEKPVLLAMDDRPDSEAEPMFAAFRESLARHNRRGIVWFGGRHVCRGSLPRSLHSVEEELPMSWLVGHSAACIHSGRAATTGWSALAGVPSIVMPRLPEQRFWAERLTRLGIGSSCGGLPTLSDALGAVLTDVMIQVRCAKVAEYSRAEPGARAVVSLVNKIVEERRKISP